MPKILCRLPNASAKINGHTFVSHRDGMISEELDQAAADHFLAIPGYEIHDPAGTAVAAEATKKASPAKQSSPPPAAPPAAGAQASGKAAAAGAQPPAGKPAAAAEAKTDGDGAKDPSF